MKVLCFFPFITLFSTVHPSLTPTKKICRDCRYFIGDSIESGKFSNTNLITRKITYDSAWSVRVNDKKCGENANHFEENHFKIITVPYYFLKDYWLLSFPSALLCFYVYVLHK